MTASPPARSMRSLGTLIASLALAGVLAPPPASVGAEPFVPTDDAMVLERLPEKRDPSLAELKRLQLALKQAPHDVELAVRVARRAIQAARATGDLRFVGQAQGALAPWWKAADAPAPVLVLRATIRQSTHDFTGALADLERLLAARPLDGQALLTRATVLTVIGRYAEAQQDCAKLEGRAPELVTVTCLAGAASLAGQAEPAYRRLVHVLAKGADASPEVRSWAVTLAAEIAARRGDAVAADAHFREALAIDRQNAYLLGAYADFLLGEGRAPEVVALLRDQTRNDVLLLWLTLAHARIAPGSRPERRMLEEQRAELGARFAASRARGDTVHGREEARYALELEGDAPRALRLARANWEVQREPADLRILIEAARAAGDEATLRAARDWIAKHRLEDRRIAALLGTRP